jgi:hypothetical protein
MIEHIDPLAIGLMIGFMRARGGGRPPGQPVARRQGSEPSWRRIIGIVATMLGLAMSICVWMIPETDFLFASQEILTQKYHMIAYIGGGATFVSFLVIMWDMR